MMRRFILSVALTLAAAAPALAQANPGRAFLTINGGVQLLAPQLSDHFEFRSNVETATVDVRYPATTSVLFDAGVGITFWKRLGIGIAVSRTTGSGAARVKASIPHPLVYDRPRAVVGDQRAITRAESAAHMQLLYTLPAPGRWSVVLSAGPTYVNVEQELATDVQYDETYPFDEATFRAATTRRAKASAIGANAALDVRRMVGRHFGLGGLVRFTRASVDLDTGDNRRLKVDAGGLQAGAGLRIAF